MTAEFRRNYIIRIARRGLFTAAQVARAVKASERTIYRDIRALRAAGVPIAGEHGIGYLLREKGASHG